MSTTIQFSVNNYYTQLFNNESFSDFRIQFSNNTTLSLHKVILAQSDFFRACFGSNMLEATESTMLIEENAELMTSLLQSLYSNELTVKQRSDIVPMLLLADQFQLDSAVTHLVEHLLSGLKRENVLECLELNLENVKFQQIQLKVQKILSSEADQILLGDTYLSLDVTKWMSLLKILTNSKTVLAAYDAVHKWIEVDESTRAQYSYALTSLVRSYSLKKPVSFEVMFNPDYVSSHMELINEKRIKKVGPTGWNCCALGTKCSEFSVRICSNPNDSIMIGFVPLTAQVLSGQNFESRGWFLHTYYGRIFSQSRGDQYCRTTLSTVKVKLADGCISYTIDGYDFGTAFTGVSGDLYPAIELYHQGSEVEFL